MKILIIGAAWCGYCRKAKELCEQYSLDYSYEDFDMDVHGVKYSGFTLPIVVVNDEYIGGYKNLAIEIESLGLGNYGQGAF